MSGSQQPLLGYGTSAYRIANSLRFRSSASAYLNRTPSVAGNQTTWTFSAWVKRGSLGSEQHVMDARTGSNFPSFTMRFTSSDVLEVAQYTTGGTNQFIVTTTQVFRDPSSWYHIVYAIDTTQSTSTNRIKLYVNGNQVTAFGTATYPSQNLATNVNSTNAQYINSSPTNSAYFDGYLADINFIDGQALTPSSFGAFNATTGVWGPISYTGTYGTNGFHLPFSNGSSATPTGLGKDTSGASSTAIVGTSSASSTTLTVVSVTGISVGNIVTGPGIPSNTYVTAIGVLNVTLSQAATSSNVSTTYTFSGNNWLCNNISLTAGSTYDWMIDSPTPYQGSSYGVGNYAVLNPLYKGYGGYTATAVGYSNANLTVTGNTSGNNTIATMALPSSGKFYYEYIWTANSGGEMDGGIINPAGTAYFYRYDGTYYNGSSYVAYGAVYTVNDVIGVAVDMDNLTFTFYKNNVSQGVKTSAFPSGATYLPWFYCSNTVAADINFGQRPFTYTPPSGYKSLCTFNLPTPTIQNGAGYMAATLYTGTLLSNAVSNAVNGVSFQPDFVWIKSRSAATDHKLTDSVRGTTKALISDSTAAETTDSQGLTTFGSSGFTVGTDIVYNNLAATYIGWQWKAGGTAVTNAAGSITSSVSANTTSGFSVVTYTGTGANATVGHGLGVAPSMIIVKVRSTTNDWIVYHSGLPTPATQILYLDLTNAVATSASIWNSTSPTSSVFSLGTQIAVNQASSTYVAYCFAAIPGYSAFGSYTGNGSADGPFVYCGFRPRYVMYKRSDSTGDWYVWDTARDPVNVAGNGLFPNYNVAESSYGVILDIVSNGFKLRTNGVVGNVSAATYIFACFAENPFTNALAR